MVRSSELPLTSYEKLYFRKAKQKGIVLAEAVYPAVFDYASNRKLFQEQVCIMLICATASQHSLTKYNSPLYASHFLFG